MADNVSGDEGSIAAYGCVFLIGVNGYYHDRDDDDDDDNETTHKGYHC